MPVSAYILIEAEQGKVKEVQKGVAKVQGVKQAHAITGIYDCIAYVEAKDLKTLGTLVVGKVQKVPGVLRTITNVVVQL